MLPDDILRPSDHEFYRVVQKWTPPSKARSPEQLTADAYKAHDNIKELVHERDRLQKALIDLNKQLDWERQWRHWLIWALVLTWTSWATAVWWVSKVIAPLIVKGLAK